MSSRQFKTITRMFQVRGRLALFSRIDSGRDKVTYMFPTPGSIRGLCQTLYHTHRLAFTPITTEILAPLQVVAMRRHNLKGIVYGGEGISKLEGAPDSALYLLDVHYRVTVEIEGPSDDIRRWERRLDGGAFASPPFLGVRECMAFVGPVDDTPVVPVTLLEPRMYLNNNGVIRPVQAVNGVVTYPSETKKALMDRRRGVCLNDILKDEEATDVV